MTGRRDIPSDQWWRNLDGYAGLCEGGENTPAPEFPFGVTPETPSRRQALQLLTAAALALPAAACSRAPEHIVPYVELPEGLTPGKPLTFATSLLLGGIAQPVIVESHEGRPTKVEGNPQHPASLGRTDAFAQAAILSLYDPARSKTVLKNGQIASWADFLAAIARASRDWSPTGAGLRLLSGRTTSPTLLRQITKLKRQYPSLVWHRWEPINDDSVLSGAELAFGQRLEPHYRLDQADVIVALDADLLGPGPRQVTHGIAFSEGRRARANSRKLTRLHVAEPLLTLTGAMADSRHRLKRSEVADLAWLLAARLGADVPAPKDTSSATPWLDMVAREIEAHQGRALVAVGPGQPAHVHALAAWINYRIGAVGSLVSWREPIEVDPGDHGASISALAHEMAAGQVQTLVILGGNPAYDAPADLGFTDALGKVPLSVHLGQHVNETAELVSWHIPELHPLESWSDARAADGSIGIIQPLITPLYDGRSAHDVVAVLSGNFDPSSREIVQEHWRETSDVAQFDQFWRQTLHDGFTSLRPPEASQPAGEPRLPQAPAAQPRSSGFEIVFAPDESVWDGSFAENAWLQELPNPLTKEVWGNAASLAPADADGQSIREGDIVRIEIGERRLELPAVIAPGQAAGTIGLKLGYGRRTGVIANGIGANAYSLRASDGLWAASGASLVKTGGHVSLARTQVHRSMRGQDIVRTMSLAELASARQKPAPGEPATSLYPTFPPGKHAWAMVIDQSVCIGCNACVTACQAENNIPVVGPDEVRRGRDMQWLRVDLYFKGSPDDPDTLFQPVPCMHCEKAPCEPVCPVEASVHDSEGLNVQVYNRCIGTRFCQANCPYKVRHFNFYGYADGQEYKNLGAPIIEAAHNPDVTVRARGVMEKCTYCVQRISGARRLAERENRPIREGEVVTACAQACPTRAIIFGDLLDKDSEVARLRRQPHEYALLADLGTRPRTTYLARVRDTEREDERS